MCEKGIFGANL